MQSAINVVNPAMPVRTEVLTIADTSNPLLRIKYKDKGKDANSPTPYCALTITAAGSGGSKLILFLDIGASAASYHQYQFDAYTAATTDPRGIASGTGITHTQCTTLKALINALNAIDGITAHRLHAPADYTLDSDDFAALAVTQIGSLFTDRLYRDVDQVGASTTPYALRIGVPDDVNGKIGRGRLALVRINSYINGTAAQMKLSYDPNETDESEEVDVGYSRLVTDAAWTALFDFTDSPPVFQGPLLLELWDSSAAAIADNGVIVVQYQNAEY